MKNENLAHIINAVAVPVIVLNRDLIVIAADPGDWWMRRLLRELIKPLLRWIDRPVLVTKP